jgi:murein DD-endopeptidase MepM/ murein hydrolase activator NlpD
LKKADNTFRDLEITSWFSTVLGVETLYSCLSKYKCRAGQQVKWGDIIGWSTGRSEGPHLHYRVHKKTVKWSIRWTLYRNISAVEYVAICRLANQENRLINDFRFVEFRFQIEYNNKICT